MFNASSMAADLGWQMAEAWELFSDWNEVITR